MKTFLFLCTGNYYRSRIAEEVFNHLCDQLQTGLKAVSRGLGHRWPNPANIGPISQSAVTFLSSLAFTLLCQPGAPCPVHPQTFSKLHILSAWMKRNIGH